MSIVMLCRYRGIDDGTLQAVYDLVVLHGAEAEHIFTADHVDGEDRAALETTIAIRATDMRNGRALAGKMRQIPNAIGALCSPSRIELLQERQLSIGDLPLILSP